MQKINKKIDKEDFIRNCKLMTLRELAAYYHVSHAKIKYLESFTGHKALKSSTKISVEDVRNFLPLYREFFTNLLASANVVKPIFARLYAIAHKANASNDDLNFLSKNFILNFNGEQNECKY